MVYMGKSMPETFILNFSKHQNIFIWIKTLVVNNNHGKLLPIPCLLTGKF